MKKKNDAMTIKWIRKVSGGSLRWVGLLTLLRIVQGGIFVGYAYALGRVVDCAAAGDGRGFLRQLAVFIALVLATVLLHALGRYLSEKSKALLERSFRLHAFSQLLHRDYARVTDTHTGEWMTRITSDAQVVSNGAATILPEVAGALVRLLGAALALLQIVPTLVYIILPCGLVMAVFSWFLRKWLKKLHKGMQEADGSARSFLQERLAGLLVVRSFSQEAATEAMAAERMEGYVHARMRRFRLVNLSHTLLSGAIRAAQVLGIALCGWGILRGVLSFGTMSAVMYLVNMLEAPFAAASGYLSQYYSMLASAERLMEPEEFDPDLMQAPVSSEEIHRYYREEFAALEIAHAEFSYEGKAALLRDLNLHIKKGSFAAFTGESGCGKSTVLKLLLCLYPLQGGGMFLQSENGARIPLDASWRGLFAYVPQGNALISGTIRQTLTFCDPELMARDEEISKALAIACADEFVNALPEGLDTRLGEGGSGLSEGQLQRLCVARAILSGRPVLLLDEATSALDGETEARLLENLRAMTDRTVLIVTHREAALQHCDQEIACEKTGGK